MVPDGYNERYAYCPVALFAQTNAHEKSVTTTDAVEHLEALARQKGIPAKYIEETLQKDGW